jgi:hypothetical protein
MLAKSKRIFSHGQSSFTDPFCKQRKDLLFLMLIADTSNTVRSIHNKTTKGKGLH